MFLWSITFSKTNEKTGMFCVFGNPFHVWCNRRWLNSRLGFCFECIGICCFGWSIWRKSSLVLMCSWEKGVGLGGLARWLQMLCFHITGEPSNWGFLKVVRQWDLNACQWTKLHWSVLHSDPILYPCEVLSHHKQFPNGDTSHHMPKKSHWWPSPLISSAASRWQTLSGSWWQT